MIGSLLRSSSTEEILLMFQAVEVGARVGKEDYEAEIPDLRVRLLNAQFDLRKANFPVVLLLAGNDLQGCAETLSLFSAWMDARDIRFNVSSPPIPGIITSRRTRSMPPFSTRASASSPC